MSKSRRVCGINISCDLEVDTIVNRRERRRRSCIVAEAILKFYGRLKIFRRTNERTWKKPNIPPTNCEEFGQDRKAEE